MKIILPSWKKQAFRYLETHSKGGLLAGALVFLPAIVFTFFAISQIFVPINGYVANGMPWDSRFNDLLAGILLNMFLLIPAIILFVVAYLQAESNLLGVKLSFGLSVGFLVGLIVNFSSSYLLLFCMIFCILATIVGLEEARNNKNKKSTPIVVEKVAVLGLRISGVICIVVLFGIIAYVAIRGSQFLSWDFITSNSLPYSTVAERIAGFEPGPIGGVRDFIIGSLLIAAYCEAIAIPLGIGAAIYLSEYAPKNRFIDVLRFFIETLAGAPSIVIGLFGFTYFVSAGTGLGLGYSMTSAGLALAFMILPWNIRVAEEAMRAVPQAYREASYALGATKWQTIKKTVLLPASPGAITGILLGLGGVIGETAVLIFTAGSLGTSTLPKQISLIGGQGQSMPALANWILGAFRGVRAIGTGTTTTIIWQQGNVVYTGALVLLIIFFIIISVGLILRNYLAKKTRGA